MGKDFKMAVDLYAPTDAGRRKLRSEHAKPREFAKATQGKVLGFYAFTLRGYKNGSPKDLKHVAVISPAPFRKATDAKRVVLDGIEKSRPRLVQDFDEIELVNLALDKKNGTTSGRRRKKSKRKKAATTGARKARKGTKKAKKKTAKRTKATKKKTATKKATKKKSKKKKKKASKRGTTSGSKKKTKKKATKKKATKKRATKRSVGAKKSAKKKKTKGKKKKASAKKSAGKSKKKKAKSGKSKRRGPSTSAQDAQRMRAGMTVQGIRPHYGSGFYDPYGGGY